MREPLVVSFICIFLAIAIKKQLSVAKYHTASKIISHVSILVIEIWLNPTSPNRGKGYVSCECLFSTFTIRIEDRVSVHRKHDIVRHFLVRCKAMLRFYGNVKGFFYIQLVL